VLVYLTGFRIEKEKVSTRPKLTNIPVILNDEEKDTPTNIEK
jgi:hypothetical protein